MRVCLACGQPTQAEHYASQAAAAAPQNINAQLELANLFIINNKCEKALTLLSRLAQFLATHPALSSVLSMAASAALELNRCCEAHQLATQAVIAAERHGQPAPASTLAATLLNIGEASKAFETLRAHAMRFPSDTGTLGGLCLISNYIPGITRSQQYELAARFGSALKESVTPVFNITQYKRNQLPRIGILSPDLRSHSVAYFIEPLLANYDHSAAEIWVYQTNAVSDNVTKRLVPLAHSWKVIDTLNDDQLADLIASDNIDILIELSGHTHANSLRCMARRAAPVQMTYLGYPNVTGVDTIDYRIVDSITDPPGTHPNDSAQVNISEPALCENFLRLDPTFICYTPPRDAPSPSLLAHEGIMFGSFNNVQKISNELLKLWARVLDAVPGSGLCLKGVAYSEEAMRRHLTDRASECGIDPSRLTILPRSATTQEHLSQYAKIDIALDTWPYGGTTTTCEALYMGVPVITLTSGDTHASRVGASILTSIGLSHLIAPDSDSYITTARQLASDRALISQLRQSLRNTLLTSSICDAQGFAARFINMCLRIHNTAHQ